MYPSLLFVCALNTCRSIVGHAVFDYIKDQTTLVLQIASAGIWAIAEQPCDPHIKMVAAQRGYDLSAYQSTSLATLEANDYSHVFIFEQAHFEPVRQWMGEHRRPEYIMMYSKYFAKQEVLMHQDSDITSAYMHIFDLIEDGCLGFYKQLLSEKENHDI